MILQTSKIAELLSRMAEIPLKDALKETALIELIGTEIEKRCKPGVDIEKHEEALSYYTAAKVFYQLTVSQCAASRADSITAGDMKITQGTEKRRLSARELEREVYQFVRPLFMGEDTDFLFQSMDGKSRSSSKESW